MTDNYLSFLKDIQYSIEISYWPLGFGWWILLFISILALIIFLDLKKEKTWKYQVKSELKLLIKKIDDNNARNILSKLSELIRYIAINYKSRKECAGLAGKDWLKWLSNNDPKGFDWTVNGNILLNDNYAPKTVKVDKDKVKLLLDAIFNWVK